MGCDIDTLRALSSARMLSTASKLAGLGAVAIIHAIGVPLRTDEVGNRLAVLG